MTTKQTHRTHGWIARNLLLAGAAAFALSAGTQTASASTADDPIAYWLGNGNLAAGQALLKANKSNPINADTLYQATIKALTDPTTPTSLTQKTTPSAVATAALKLIPSYSPGIAGAGSLAALQQTPPSTTVWKLTAATALKDAQKTSEQAITLGLKKYTKAPINEPSFTGVTPANLANAASVIAYQVTYGAQQGGSASQASISALTTSLVKKSVAASKINPLTPAGIVTGLVANFAGEQEKSITSDIVKGVINGAVKGAKTQYIAIAQAAAYALAGTYIATGGTDGPEGFNITQISEAIALQITLAGVKASDALLFNVTNAVQTGIGAAFAGYSTLGAGGVSDGDDLFAFNNGKPNPITDVQGE